MNQVFAPIFFIFVLSPNLLAWSLLQHCPTWLQDAESEIAGIGIRIRDSIRAVEPFSLGSAWVPLIRMGNNYVEQMSQRLKRMQELRFEIHRLRQIGKISEALEAEEELLRLIELGALPEKLQSTEAWKIGLGLSEMPGELFLPTSGEKYQAPGLYLVPGAIEPAVQPESSATSGEQTLPRASSPNEPVHSQASQVNQRVHATGVSSQVITHVARTQIMRVDPLRGLENWYQGFRVLKDLPTLEWELGRKSLRRVTFEEAEAYASGHSGEGWRLPTIWELEGLYQQRSVLGEDDDGAWYWSDTSVVGYAGFCWAFNFRDGIACVGDVFVGYRVRLVREVL
ncbi:MAG: DUF1566 domain-containing protein [Myxococcaceae bacterium]|nr:DUF1566 domain-containing protein [Myxococcaceae bacterium]MBH2006086.1 DUF1566 domain-containing protein [Myxococcaceae bacterium]